MPTVRTGDIRGAYVGEREAGAMLMGNKIIWNRTALYTRTNNSAPAVPDWATFFTAILVGGGAGGQAGNGGVGSQGAGGRSGDVRFVSDSIHPGSSLSLVIGKVVAAAHHWSTAAVALARRCRIENTGPHPGVVPVLLVVVVSRVIRLLGRRILPLVRAGGITRRIGAGLPR